MMGPTPIARGPRDGATRAAILSIAALCGASGCAAMTSHGPQSKMALDKSHSATGFSYYLPKRMARLVFERFEIDKEAAKKLAEKSAELKKLQGLLAETKLAVTDAESLRGKLEDPGNPPSEELNEARAKLAAAEVAYAVVERNIASATKAVMAAEAAVESAKFGDRLCGYADRFTIALLAPVADPNRRYVIEPHHTWSRKDEFNLKTTKSGLLSSVTSKVTDQTGEILVSLASGRAAVRATSGAGVIRGTLRTMDEPQEKPPEKKPPDPCWTTDGKPRVLPLKVEEILDPTDKDALERFSVEITSRALVKATPTQTALFDDKYNLSALVAAEGQDTTIGNGSKDSEDKVTGRMDVAAGLAYRRELPMLLYAFSQKAAVETPCTAKPPRRKECTILGSWMLEIPNGSPIEVLPAKSGLFVQTDLKFEFDQGMLISHDAVRPSEIARVAALPVEYAMSILEIPAKIIQLRVNLGTQETALTTNETAAITAEIARLEALQKLEEARKAEEDAEASGE